MADQYGPYDWHIYFPGWEHVGPRTWENKPGGQALPDADIHRLSADGIGFAKLIGKGGFGEVWKTILTKFKTNQQNNYVPVVLACKITSLKSHFPKRTLRKAVYEVCREIDVLKLLSHPHIIDNQYVIRLFDETHDFPHPTYALCFMELMQANLRQLIKYLGKMNEDLAVNWFIQIADALRYLHQSDRDKPNGIAHFDIKPDNILLKEHPLDQDLITLKLSDFGLAERFQPTESYSICGTEDYMAPELKSGQRGPYDGFKCDIYSLGVTLTESMCGLSPRGQVPPLMLRIVQVIQQKTKFTAISGNLQHLIRGMTLVEPNMRLSIDQVMGHQWLTSVRSTYVAGRWFRLPQVINP